MGLLNYTSTVDADKSAQEIAKALSMHGAKAVLTEYDEKEGLVKAISFKITVNGQDMGFRLPCDWKPVYAIMYKDKSTRTIWDKDRAARLESGRKDQAIRTAWRIVKDWVVAQMALIETQMVTTQQVFMPYLLMKDDKTLYEKMVENPQFLLGDGN